MRSLFILLTLLLASACSTVTITQKGTSKIAGPATYTDRKPFFLAGIIGEHTVDAKQVCNGGNAKQIQTKQYFLDGFLEVVTLLIYSPRVVHVWCDGGRS